MNTFTALLVLALLVQSLADPVPKADPKKYNKQSKDTKITDEEKKFIKDVEARFNIKGTDDVEIVMEAVTPKEDEESTETPASLPAVIAIEIVNDTDSFSKGKRTIDANLGYGYRTNGGFRYSYFGQPRQEKGKFMIYPYSQHDIPPLRPNIYASPSNLHLPQISNYQQVEEQKPYIAPIIARQRHQNRIEKYQNVKPVTEVEIRPSHAYQLVHENQYSNQQEDFATPPLRVDYNPSQAQYYEPNHSPPQQTFYTTYNGGKLSGLSGQFPSVPNYLVDSEKLLKHPQLQNLGISQNYLHAQGGLHSRKVVPVYVIRIPSSHINNPSGSLYPNLPQNYPNAHNLNTIDFRSLVSEYLAKQPQNQQHANSNFVEPVSNYETPQNMEHYSAQQEPQQLYTQAIQQVDEAVQQNDVPQQYSQYGAPGNSQENEDNFQQYETPQDGHQNVEVAQQYSVPENLQQYQAQGQSQEEFVPSQEYGTPQQVENQEEIQTPQQHNQYYENSQSSVENIDPHQTFIQAKLQQLRLHGGRQRYIPAAQSESAYEHQAPQESFPNQVINHSPEHSASPNLQITENYPSASHTQVIFPPAPVQVGGHLGRQGPIIQSVGYVTPPPEVSRKLPYLVMAPNRQIVGVAGRPASFAPYSGPFDQDRGYSGQIGNEDNLRFVPRLAVQQPHGFSRGYRGTRTTEKEQKNTVKAETK